MKWYKSVEMNADACGSFDYCAKCDKNKENPCDLAYAAYSKPVKVTKKATTTKKATATKKTTKSTTKKTTAKKTTAKKSK